MADDDRHFLRNVIIGNSHGLLRVALVVAHNGCNLLAVHTTSSVDFINGHVEAGFELFTESSQATGHRTGESHCHIGMSHR